MAVLMIDERVREGWLAEGTERASNIRIPPASTALSGTAREVMLRD